MSQPVIYDRAKLLSELQSLTEENDASARLLSTKQVALLFGVGDRTIRVWAKKQLIPTFRTPGRHWKFSALEIMRTYKGGMKPEQLSLQQY